MKDNWEIQFIKPCRLLQEEHRLLTPEYAASIISLGKIVQINLDNCSIQRMEMLNDNSSLQEVEEVGLLPLVNILKTGLVSLTAIGVNEMPDLRVPEACAAYERFCRMFWSGHKNDQEATSRAYDETNTAKKVDFNCLEDGARCTYGPAYVSIMQIHNIQLNYKHETPEKQFELYLYSIISLLGVISAFELEIAKYAFWDISSKEINQLSDDVRIRRKDIKENFTKVKSSMAKCKEFAFDAAMDIHWLSGANFAEDLNVYLDIDGKRLRLDNWVGTNDHKLYRISRDIFSVYHDGSNMKRLAVTREDELSSSTYWQNVDFYSKSIMEFRNKEHHRGINGLLDRIDKAVQYVEDELDGFYKNCA